ncbi:ABC transporter permease [Chitinophaga horti]|uniref:ABC transporter permease n=1 Tax=Chitinophaga horti TaxID=2920382 RepID=A0ABY6IXV0_9BACT|nr:ABC transporter permease [Chitinophaga horti]UYQ92217.1 ABC transporter permease [Chitinophaga horti]
MNKIWLIIKREYLTRVRKKAFLITTLLVPIFFAATIVIPVLIAKSGNSTQKVAVVDDSKLFDQRLADSDNVHFKFLEANADTLKKSYQSLGYNGLLHIPKLDLNRPSGIVYYSEGQMNVGVKSQLERRLNELIEERRMEVAGIDKEKLKDIRSDVDIVNKTGKDEREGSSKLAFAVGYGCGFIIYIILLVFGMSVLRGVTEEKVNRIAEVVVSSVKPFQLMMGKIFGIAAVGLTQFIIWIILIFGLYTAILLMVSPAEIQSAQSMQGSMNNEAAEEIARSLAYVGANADWLMIIICFIFYFLGGYLFYASLFAAVGSLVNEDPNDIQGLTFPITVPLIIAIVIMMGAVSDPTSKLAVWASIIPFTSPIVMMARIPYGVPGTVPVWQLALSMVMLIGGFILTTWMAGKIYRTGILMYGKKITLKEAIKWIVKK